MCLVPVNLVKPRGISALEPLINPRLATTVIVFVHIYADYDMTDYEQSNVNYSVKIL